MKNIISGCCFLLLLKNEFFFWFCWLWSKNTDNSFFFSFLFHFYFYFLSAGVTYNSQKREPRIFQQPGGGGVVEDAFLLTGAPLTQRLNDIYSMSDDEDDMIESISDVNSSGIDISSSKILYHPENGQQLYGNVKQVKMQLGL